jgi:L-lactate dehydrogenase (FMN-dependent) and related alpha-hydroxy acid dehydrogenases
MRNKVHLEKKTATQLNDLRRVAKIPFVIKGVFTREDLDLVKEMKPDAALVSNHGGRVETEEGSSADFLREHIQELRKYCGAVWVDGGIRTKEDVVAAKALGADQVLLARPLIRDFLKSRQQ